MSIDANNVERKQAVREISKKIESDLVVVPHGREAPLGLYRRAYGPNTSYAKERFWS